MLRWLPLAVLLLILCACSTPSKPLEEVLPASVDGWTRTETSALETGSAPDMVKRLGLKRAIAATYTGPATVTLHVYEMNVATSAFELIQQWRQQDGLAVYNGAYFVVAGRDSGPEASKLLEAIRKQLP
jgi:hypothetical protein